MWKGNKRGKCNHGREKKDLGSTVRGREVRKCSDGRARTETGRNVRKGMTERENEKGGKGRLGVSKKEMQSGK